MKSIVIFVLLSTLCMAQNQVRTVTRTVAEFGGWERELATAKSAADRAAFLTDDFEERLCAAPSTPVPRDQWLASPPSNWSLSQEAVHEYGDVSIYSALADDGKPARISLVDVWKRTESDWKLAVRYRCPATGAQPQGTIQKRY